MWCWRMMNVSWADRVRTEEVLQKVKKERNIHNAINGRKVNLTGHILRSSCLLKHDVKR